MPASRIQPSDELVRRRAAPARGTRASGRLRVPSSRPSASQPFEYTRGIEGGKNGSAAVMGAEACVEGRFYPPPRRRENVKAVFTNAAGRPMLEFGTFAARQHCVRPCPQATPALPASPIPARRPQAPASSRARRARAARRRGRHGQGGRPHAGTVARPRGARGARRDRRRCDADDARRAAQALPAPTAHRLLATLERGRLRARRAPSGEWLIGVRAFRVGSAFLVASQSRRAGVSVSQASDGGFRARRRISRWSRPARRCSSSRCNAAS